MRIWSVHPRYLDPQGLVALWREALLAQKVLRGETTGYSHHPQLARFRNQADPAHSIAVYLLGVWDEADRRGYHFERSKIGAAGAVAPIPLTAGQLDYEWSHLLAKLRRRSPLWASTLDDVSFPQTHSLFYLVPGEAAEWEIVRPVQPKLAH